MEKRLSIFSIIPALLLIFSPQTAYTEQSGSWDPSRGVYTIQNETKNGIQLSTEIGVSYKLTGAGAFFIEQREFSGGFDGWINAHIGGDIGNTVSYYFEIGVGLLSAERRYLGEYQLKVDNSETAGIYSWPSAYFPYAYHGQWDGFVFPLDRLSAGGPTGWPDTLSIGFNMLGEITGAAFDNTLLWSLGRKRREWAAVSDGSSLVLNETAQPFLGVELLFRPFPWFSFSSLTGMLEYFSSKGIKTSAETFQNAFSLSMLDIDITKYVHINFGTTVIWPKRFELGYLFPLIDNMLYQNFIGDFDNAGLFGSIKLQMSGVGFLWASFFLDEMNFEENFFKLDRQMYALQAGLKAVLPMLPFASVDLSYTKIEPYCYTHQKTAVPWYSVPMEQAYVNHGYGLGYYLPPNSDEIKLKMQMMPSFGTLLNIQFQMIRRGADYGDSAVDGSSYLSELAESGRSSNPGLRKYFLQDGAYQWLYIIKGGLTHNFSRLPLELYVEAGVVFSYWTDIDGNANDGAPHPYRIIDTDTYPQRTGLIANIGIQIYR
ncbi:MAG: hypothetical protein FWC03_09445 [Treponema sp.]|nr:hypothetical protein [Treponema sp.]